MTPRLTRRPVATATIVLLALAGAFLAGRPALYWFHDSIESYYPRELSLIEQAKRGELQRIQQAVDANPRLANTRRDDGVPILYLAAANGHAESVAYLIERGAAVDAKIDYGGALHAAVKGEHIAVVEVLLRAKANPNLQNDWGEAPLHNTTRHRDGRIARMLIEGGADVSAIDHQGRTPLHRCKSLPVAKVLVQAGASVNAQDSRGCNALHWAASPREIVDRPTVEFLLQQGIDVSAKNREGLTPLEFARQSKQESLVVILQRHGEEQKSRRHKSD